MKLSLCFAVCLITFLTSCVARSTHIQDKVVRKISPTPSVESRVHYIDLSETSKLPIESYFFSTDDRGRINLTVMLTNHRKESQELEYRFLILDTDGNRTNDDGWESISIKTGESTKLKARSSVSYATNVILELRANTKSS